MNLVRPALAAFALFYPSYWLAMFVVRALPAFVKMAVLGEQLLWLRSRPFYIAAVSVPAGMPQASGATGSQPPLLTALLATTACLLICLLPSRFRLPGGLFLVCLGHVGISGPLGRWVFRSNSDWESAAGVVLYFALLVLGLWFITRAVPLSGLARRLLLLTVCVLIPISIFLFIAARSIDVVYFSVGLGPLMFATGLVAAMRTEPAQDATVPGWRMVAAGLAATVLIATAASAGAMQEAQSKAEARRKVMASIPKPVPDAPYPRLFFQKGVNFTAEGPVGYSPESSVRVLEHLFRNGVNAIALVPYGFSPLGRPEVRRNTSWERDEDIEAITALAHRMGVKVMLKPQIWVGRGWPADIHFEDAKDRTEWFRQYREFLEHYARLASKIHADIFCIGVEFARMTAHEKEWRELIAVARGIYPGPLVYGAVQGPEFETIRFWDALDYIGLNNYYPMPDDLSTDDMVRRVEKVQAQYQRPVVFTEAGFSSYKDPHRAPWDETPRDLSPQDQARCYEAILNAFYHKPWFQGVYWWKVGTNGYGGVNDGSHTPWGKPAMEVVAHWYTKGGR